MLFNCCYHAKTLLFFIFIFLGDFCSLHLKNMNVEYLNSFVLLIYFQSSSFVPGFLWRISKCCLGCCELGTITWTWSHASSTTMKRYVYINDDESSHDLYCANRISNTKYNVLNFLPKNLWEQFRWFVYWCCLFYGFGIGFHSELFFGIQNISKFVACVYMFICWSVFFFFILWFGYMTWLSTMF